MSTPSTAQHCKRYREKHQEYWEKHVIQKRHKCMVMKASDSIANEEGLRKERERKRAHRQRKKAEASNQLTRQHKIDQHLRVHRSRIHHSYNFPRELGHLKNPTLFC